MNSWKTALSLRASVSVMALAGGVAPAQAAVTISTAATTNMTCSGGTCAPTASSAVLNVGDLETLLASGNVTVTTTGSGVQAKNIRIKAALAWSSTGALTLDASHSIAIDQAVSVTGVSGLSLETNGKSGGLSFGSKGNVGFANLSSTLTINGASYTLVNTIGTLASAIASNPGGNYSFAASYDASTDGTYSSAPIATAFGGKLEGLGNAISHLAITDTKAGDNVGLFAKNSGNIENFSLAHLGVKGGSHSYVGGLVGQNAGLLSADFVSGKITGINEPVYVGGLAAANDATISNSQSNVVVKVSGDVSTIGGLVGVNGGVIDDSHATGAVTGGQNIGGLAGDSYGKINNSYATGAVTGSSDVSIIGGLVGANGGKGSEISYSYATGTVTVGLNSRSNYVGGLAGINGNDGKISDSYATGAVTGDANDYIGGLVGLFNKSSSIVSCYSIGAVTPNSGGYFGGLIGYVRSKAGIADSYWDTDTSGIANLSQGAGNVANDPGIMGLTTTQFQSGLPTGFDPSIWSENADINGGLPYLLANPPPT